MSAGAGKGSGGRPNPGFWLRWRKTFSHGFDRNNEFNLLILEIRSEARALGGRKEPYDGSGGVEGDSKYARISGSRIIHETAVFLREDFHNGDPGEQSEGGARISVLYPHTGRQGGD